MLGKKVISKESNAADNVIDLDMCRKRMMGKKVVSKESNAADNVIDLDIYCSPLSGTPLSPIYCVKNVETMREIEKTEDCFILGFDPDRPVVSDLYHKFENSNVYDVRVLSEKGQVACRDYPHSRHVCLKYPFETTPHKNYCELCYCFVCDLSAPCKMWSGVSGHCHATDNEVWNCLRKDTRRRMKVVSK